MDENENKTTAEDFEYFKAECRRWLDFFGIKNYRVFYSHEPVEDGFAECAWSTPGRVVKMKLNPEWAEAPVDNPSLSRTAFHEICELLLSELTEMAQQWVCNAEVNRTSHQIIRTLENTVWEREYAEKEENGSD